MRFMIIVKATAETEAGIMPSSAELAEMGRFNEEMIDAGVMLAGEGLMPSSKGARIGLHDGKVLVTDGPFTEAKELIAGFWLIQVKDRDEAIAWARRIPFTEAQDVELRQVFETADFQADEVSGEHLRREEEWRQQTQRPLTR